MKTLRQYSAECAAHGITIIFILLAVLLFSPLRSFGAETAKLRYFQSIYFDDKGASLKEPEGVACNDKSVLVVADTGNDRLLRYTFQERSLKGGSPINIPQLTSPIRVQINSKGEIFALDGKRRRVVRLSPEGAFKGYVEPDGVPSPSAFVPRSFKIDRNDNIYILDIFTARVLILNPEGKYQKQIPFPQEYGFFSDLAINPKGDVLLVDCVKAMVLSAAKESSGFTPLAKNLREYSGFLTSMSTDHQGIIYLVDEDGGGVVILGGDGSFMGRQLTMGWTEGLLYFPSQMCINGKGEVFIADRSNSRVQIFTLVK
jgi:DNA-binding beta-propeller fold protein YncE